MNTLLTMRAEKAVGDIQELTAGFPEEHWHTPPSYGGWSAAEVSEHIIKASTGLPRLLNGNTIACDREPAEKIAVIESIFLNYSQKLQSPDFLVPSGKMEKVEAVAAWKNIKEEFIAATQIPDLTRICADRELPRMGTLTRLEWLNFCLTHLQRHTHQLKNISSDFQHKP